jgi:hypothetical protein
MSLKVMEQLGLKTTHPYGNVCGIDSKKVKVYGLIEDVEVYLHDFPHISLIMNIVVIDVPDAWGMLLSRSWVVPWEVFSAWISLMHTFPWEMVPLRFYIVTSSQETCDGFEPP